MVKGSGFISILSISSNKYLIKPLMATRLNSCSINLNIEPINCEQLLKMYRINAEHGRGRHVPHGLFCDLFLSHMRWAHVRAFG